MGISTHILDTALGRPAAGVPVTLAIFQEGAWKQLGSSHTDADGRCRNLLTEGHVLDAGVYRIAFSTAVYYDAQNLNGLYPSVEITITVTNNDKHYHIPLLLTANGYTTYRGS